MASKDCTLTQKYLKEILEYNSDTGNFIRLVRKSSNAMPGNIAGSYLRTAGKTYIEMRIDGKRCLAHRLAFLYMTGVLPKNEVDHINGDGSDNRWINLRLVTHTENQRNKRLVENNTSGHVGVSWNKRENKWRSYITVNMKQLHLGYFYDIKNAIEVRKDAEKQYVFHENHGQARPL